jgi:tetratricopeptide (TPR) repeat protein
LHHVKNEGLSAKSNRFHVTCGEGLCSETGIWLTTGATALALVLAEAGVHPGAAVKLRDPLKAARTFAADPGCTATARAVSGPPLSALDIQRHYCALAEDHLDHELMPEWAEAVCERWRGVLDEIGCAGADGVATTLDWGIKHTLYADYATSRGFAWDELKEWNTAVSKLLAAFKKGGREEKTLPDAATFGEPGGKVLKTLNSVPAFRSGRLDSSRLPDFLQLRQELFELDTRYSQLDDGGLFRQIEGQLNHRIPEVGDIADCLTTPPQDTRAKARGEAVQRYNGQPGYSCCWSSIRDGKGRYMDLSDPLKLTGEWQERRRHSDDEAGVDATGDPTEFAERYSFAYVRVANQRYDRGEYEQALVSLEWLRRHDEHTSARERLHCERLRVRCHARLGNWDAVEEYAQSARRHSVEDQCELVSCYRYLGLAPPPDIDVWIERARALQPADWQCVESAPFLGHWAYVLNRRGLPQQALALLEQARRLGASHPHTAARLLAESGEAERQLGDRATALQWLAEADQMYQDNGFLGDLADYTLTYQAKAEEAPEQSLALLDEAVRAQESLRNPIGETRSRLLIARLTDDAETRANCRHRIEHLRADNSALRLCQLLNKIRTHWHAWTADAPDPDGGHDTFWLV